MTSFKWELPSHAKWILVKTLRDCLVVCQGQTRLHPTGAWGNFVHHEHGSPCVTGASIWLCSQSWLYRVPRSSPSKVAISCWCSLKLQLLEVPTREMEEPLM